MVMQTNGINITSKISNQLQQKLSLNPGKLIKAEVVKMEGNKVMLQVGTNLLNAQTKVPLLMGEKLNLQVVSAQSNTIELKIVNDTANLKTEESILLKMGLRPQGEMNSIVQQLVKFNLPITQAALFELFNIVKGNKFTEDPTQLLVWLKTVGVKADTEKDFQALEALRKFFKGELSGDDEVRFSSFLNNSENNIYGGFNVFGWPVAGQHVFLLTQGSKDERLVPENCKLFLQLNSQSFEELWFKVEMVNNNMTVGVICNDEKYQSILTQEVDGLRQALQAVGYKIDNIAVAVSDTKLTILDFIPEQASRLFNVNLQV